MYWRRANTLSAAAGLSVGVGAAVGLFVVQKVSPELYATLNPWGLQIGAIAGGLNLATLVAVALSTKPMSAEHLSEYELH